MLPNGVNVVPYRIELTDGHMIFAPVDYEGIIRADRTVRFEVGQRVKCKMSFGEGMKDVTFQPKFHAFARLLITRRYISDMFVQFKVL